MRAGKEVICCRHVGKQAALGPYSVSDRASVLGAHVAGLCSALGAACDTALLACLLLTTHYSLLTAHYLQLTNLRHLSRTKSVSSGSSSVRLASSRCEARSSTVGLPHACKYVSGCVSKYGGR